MHPKRLCAINLAVSFATCLSLTPVFADEQDDQLAALNKRLAILETQNRISDLEKTIAANQADASSSLATSASANAVAIAANKSKKATDDATAKYADVTALQAVLGETPEIGGDGTITISENQAVLLQSRQGGILAAREAADELCAALRANKGLQQQLKGKPIVPISEQRLDQIITAKLRMLRFNEVYSAVAEASLHPVSISLAEEARPSTGSGTRPTLIDDLFNGSAKTYSAAAVIGGLAAAQSVVAAVDNLAGVARVNKAYSLHTTAREDLFESRLSTCSGVMDASSLRRRADRDRLNSSLADHYKKLQRMQAFTETVAAERRAFDTLAKDKQKATTNNAIKAREALAARVAGVSATDDSIASDLALTSMEVTISGKPILTYSLAIQDTQIKKDRFLLNDKLTYQGTAEVVYQVTGADGAILEGDAISITSKAYDVASTRSVKALANGGGKD